MKLLHFFGMPGRENSNENDFVDNQLGNYKLYCIQNCSTSLTFLKLFIFRQHGYIVSKKYDHGIRL